jgi:spore maturation protein SpmA
MDNEKNDENYSRDADQTRYIFLIGIIAGVTLLGLFILEIISMFISDHKAFVFTPEIVHTLIPVTIGGLSAVGGFLFGRGVGQRTPNGGQK